MESQLKSQGNLDHFRKLSNLLIQTPISQNISSDIPPFPVPKTSLSQQDTRENSKEDISQDEEESQSLDEVLKQLDSNQIILQKTFCDNEDDSPVLPRRSDQEMRMQYINKLVNMKVLNLQPKKKEQNVFIFDWDDTMFCTSFLGNAPLCKLPSDIQLATQLLDNTASKILQKATRAGEVFIVTNSDEGWVEQSSRQTLPKTHDIIQKKKIKVISARKDYKYAFPNDLCRWKLEAFLKLKEQFDDEVTTNLVVIGDSDIEMKAGHALKQKFKQCIFKTVKLKGCPKIDELIKQHKVVLKLFDEIFLGWKCMAVKLEKASGM